MSSSPLKNNDIIAIITVLVCYLCFSIGDAAIKFVSPHFDTEVVLFWDAFFTVLCMGIYVFFKGGITSLRTNKLKYHILKGLVGLLIGFTVIYALEHTTFAEYYMMVFTAPIWVVIFARMMMGEPITFFRSCVVIFGFAVIVYTFMPQGNLQVDSGMLSALVAASLAGFSMIFIRKYLKGEPAALLGGFNAIMVLILVAAFALPKTTLDIVWALPYMAMTGTCFFFGSLLLAKAFHMASLSAILAPFHYSQMVYGVLMGYFLFSEVPTSRTMVGSIALVLIGLALFWYDYNNNKNLRRYA